MTATASLRDVRDHIRSGARSAVEVVRESLSRIERLDPALHAFNTVTADRALDRAREMDANRQTWRDAPLAGVPLALKDNLCTRGVRTTCGSRRECRPTAGITNEVRVDF
jgi:aspartyl-tRNA(Asn)/glutamyl-tRNA(Gln) amidotransferase subunit A